LTENTPFPFFGQERFLLPHSIPLVKKTKAARHLGLFPHAVRAGRKIFLSFPPKVFSPRAEDKIEKISPRGASPLKHLLKHICNRRRSSQSALILSVLLLLPLAAWAHFTIEFHDGTQINVANYREEGEMVKVYTYGGSFAFRKADINKITETKPDEKSARSTPKETKATTNPDLDGETKRYSLNTGQGQTEKPTSPTPKRKVLDSPSTKEIVHDTFASLDAESFFQLMGSGLYHLRYLIAIAAGAKVLNIFIVGSLR
jgi:hypothetical protein